jgi:hypothetical protein
VIDAKWVRRSGIKMTLNDSIGWLGSEILYRGHERTPGIVLMGSPWSCDLDRRIRGIDSEAHRIRVAYLLGGVLAILTSPVQPFPYQISARYVEMLASQPLSSLLTDALGRT